MHPSYACHQSGVSDPHRLVLEDTMRCFAEPSLTELLSEPIVRQLMARDGTSERQVRAIATGTAPDRAAAQTVAGSGSHSALLTNQTRTCRLF